MTDTAIVRLQTNDTLIAFNSAQISRLTGLLTVSQSDQAKKIELLNTTDINREEYVSQRAKEAYILSVCQP
jgi:hypothetical protein